jgi:hypothetical protein
MQSSDGRTKIMTESRPDTLAAAMAMVAADHRRFAPDASLIDAVEVAVEFARTGHTDFATDDPDGDYPSLEVKHAWEDVGAAGLDDLAAAYDEALTLDVFGGENVHSADGGAEMPSWMGGPASPSPIEANDNNATVGDSPGRDSAYASDGQYARDIDETLASIDAALDEHASDSTDDSDAEDCAAWVACAAAAAAATEASAGAEVAGDAPADETTVSEAGDAAADEDGQS